MLLEIFSSSKVTHTVSVTHFIELYNGLGWKDHLVPMGHGHGHLPLDQVAHLDAFETKNDPEVQ